MLFSLEALQADEGDCLLVHWGEGDGRRLLLVDGGPAGIYRRSLRPRLEELKQELSPDDPLPIHLAMVSHIDGDHIVGMLDLTDELIEAHDDQAPAPFELQGLWHNSFKDVLGDTLGNAPASVAALAAGGDVPGDLPLSQPAALVVASIPQGKRLRDNANRLLPDDVNQPFGALVTAGSSTELDGLQLTVVAPDEQRIERLRVKWETHVKHQSVAQIAEYLDRSVYNLSSIVVLAEHGGKSMLLTGDARGDDIVEGLTAAGLLDGGVLEVDLLKLPHHGSNRNIRLDFFQQIRARHYVVSANGEHDNPDIDTFELLVQARADDDFTLHLTNREGAKELGARLTAFIERTRADGRTFEVVFRDGLSLTVDLLDPLKP